VEFELILAVRSEDGATSEVSLAHISRAGDAEVAMLGLRLSEGHQVVVRLQHEIVTREFAATSQQGRHCAQCGVVRAIKDYHGAKFRSLFGDVDLRVPRYVKCGCAAPPQGDAPAGTGSLRQRWISAELECVQSELAATVSYGRSAQILHMLLPVGSGHSASTVRDRTLRVGARMEAELTVTAAPHEHQSTVTTVGLDGGYVRHCCPDPAKSFEIIAGRVLAEDGSQRSVGFVRSIDKHSRTRVQRAVAEHGGARDGLMVFTDGDTRLRDLQMSVLPDAAHVLDWYHLTRRLTVLSNVINSKDAAGQLRSREQGRISEWVESIKWRLWHGRPAKAIARLDAVLNVLDRPALADKPVVTGVRKLATDLRRYLNNNSDSLPDYGRRYRAGERISTAFVESAVNQIIDKRMSKSQQMRWSPHSAHLLLQVRTRVLDGRLRQDFARWYPGFSANDSTVRTTA
jgi:hypothetical protein